LKIKELWKIKKFVIIDFLKNLGG